jgi:hypothetical protein
MTQTQKVYDVTFSQRFDESRTVFADSEEDAEQKIREVWGDEVGAEVEVDNVFSISEITEGYHENYNSGAGLKVKIEPLIEGVRDILDLIDDSPVGRMLSHMEKNKEVKH